jgi:hypothetical protein
MNELEPKPEETPRATEPEPSNVKPTSAEQPQRPRSIAERWRDIIGILEGLPPDFAQNHDHYIHGKPKR